MPSPISRLGSAETKPKILLMWGTHPNESAVTEYLANKLKPLLEQRGFDVIIKQIPEELTLHGVAKKGLGVYEPEQEWAKYIESQKRETVANFVFDLHTSAITFYNLNRKHRFLQARHTDNYDAALDINQGPPIFTYRYPEYTFLGLEFPAEYKRARKEWLDLYEKYKDSHDPNNDKRRFMAEADLNATKNAGLLSERVLGKVVYLIDRKLKVQLGINHKPRTDPFRQKTEKEIAIRIEKERRKRVALKTRMLEYLRRRLPIRFRPR